MRRISLYFLEFTLIALSFGTPAWAQDKPADKASTAASAGPTSGPRAEFLEAIAYYEQRYTRLAEAMPAEKYSWRPGEGVRSVGEVYAHIVGANYGAARALGTAPPASLDFRSIMALSGDKPQKMFGRQTTLRGSFIVITGHFGEHLGQSIAYARTNGIVPPWTEEAQQQQKPADKPKQ